MFKKYDELYRMWIICEAWLGDCFEVNPRVMQQPYATFLKASFCYFVTHFPNNSH